MNFTDLSISGKISSCYWPTQHVTDWRRDRGHTHRYNNI